MKQNKISVKQYKILQYPEISHICMHGCMCTFDVNAWMHAYIPHMYVCTDAYTFRYQQNCQTVLFQELRALISRMPSSVHSHISLSLARALSLSLSLLRALSLPALPQTALTLESHASARVCSF